MVFPFGGCAPSLPFVIECLGVTVAPLFCSAALHLAPLEAIHTLEVHVVACCRILEVTCPGPLLYGTLSSARHGLLLHFLCLSRTLVELVSQPFRRLELLPDVPFPGFIERADISLLLLQGPRDRHALRLAGADVEAASDAVDALPDALAMVDLPTNFVDAWHHIAATDDATASSVALAVLLLRAGSFEVAFFPTDPVTDRNGLLFIFFSIFSVVGVFAAEEAFVDPVGAFF